MGWHPRDLPGRDLLIQEDETALSVIAAVGQNGEETLEVTSVLDERIWYSPAKAAKGPLEGIGYTGPLARE